MQKMTRQVLRHIERQLKCAQTPEQADWTRGNLDKRTIATWSFRAAVTNLGGVPCIDYRYVANFNAMLFKSAHTYGSTLQELRHDP